MPELPEVETVKRDLAKVLINRQIKTVSVLWEKTITPNTPKSFSKLVSNQKIDSLERRAKMIKINLSGPMNLLIHLKMTGQLIFQPAKSNRFIIGGHPQDHGADNLPNKFTRLVFSFTDGSRLFFNDLRKFGWVKIVNDKEAEKIFSTLGPEPLSKYFTLNYFQSLLSHFPKRNLKQLLLDQKLISGLGNIYVDESCFLAKIKPNRQTRSLSPNETKKLFEAIKTVLKLAINKKGTSSRNYVRGDGSRGGFVPYLQVYGRANEPCKVCKQKIKKIRLAGRGTHFCPKCQN